MVPQRTVSSNCPLMHVHPRAYVCIINAKTKGKFPGELTWFVLGKQNLQAKKVYSSLSRVVSYCIILKMAVKIKDLYGNSGFHS